MCGRNLVGCILVLVLLLLPGFVGCQTAADFSTMREKIDELSKNVKKLSDEMDDAAKRSVAQKDLDPIRERVVAHERDLVQLKADLAAANDRQGKEGASAAELAGLKERLAKVEKDVQFNLEVVSEQRTVLGQIATQDNSGRWIPAIGKAKDNSQFKDDFRDAVRDAIPSVVPQLGKVRIENRMPNLQHIRVNGADHWVGPGNSLDVIVPAGSATTQLVDYEGTKNWRLDATNNYFQTVIIDRQPSYYAFVRYP